MPRYKTAKRAPKSKKAGNAHPTIKQMEKGFMQAPAKLAAILNKEIASLSKKEAKMKKAIAKTQANVIKAEARIKSQNKTAHTATAKKKLKLIIKTHQFDLNQLATLSDQIQTTTESLEQLSKHHQKLVALDKNLIQFEKEWEKNSNKKVANKAKTKVKAKHTASKQKRSIETTHAKADAHQELAREEAVHDEATETEEAIS